MVDSGIEKSTAKPEDVVYKQKALQKNTHNFAVNETTPPGCLV